MAQGLEGLQAQMLAMEERILAAMGALIADLRKDFHDDQSAMREEMRAIRAGVEMISERFLNPTEQVELKRVVSGRR